MAHILGVAQQFGKIYGIIGGLHGFSEFELFKDLELICPKIVEDRRWLLSYIGREVMRVYKLWKKNTLF